jgi:hypothetical protein
MPQLMNFLPLLFMTFAAATLILVFALLIYSIMVSASDFANRKTPGRIFRALIISALAAFAFGLASIVMILFEKHPHIL